MVSFSHTIEQTLKDISEKYNLSVFVETGTFKGTTTLIASKIFKSVYTIELSEELYEAAKEKFKDIKNIKCLHGDSPLVLASLINELDENAVFFLDAHWAGELTKRKEVDSPLLEELSVLAERNETHKDVIIIDDVSFFGKKDEFLFTNEKSAYFPEGGIFKWDWSNIDKKKVLELFPRKEILEKDDRLFIGIDRF